MTGGRHAFFVSLFTLGCLGRICHLQIEASAKEQLDEAARNALADFTAQLAAAQAAAATSRDRAADREAEAAAAQVGLVPG